MSVPKSKIISCGITHDYPKVENMSVSKGLMALTDIKTGCPTTSNSQTIFVNVNPSKKNEKKNDDDEELSDVVVVKTSPENDTPVKYVEPNPYDNLPPTTQTRELSNMDDVRKQFYELQQIIRQKENIAMALSIILNLIENNPLIINKLVIPTEECLLELLKLLTDADEIQITKLDCDIGCSCKAPSTSIINKIYITKNGQTNILKYSYPDVIKIFDTHNISLTMVCE